MYCVWIFSKHPKWQIIKFSPVSIYSVKLCLKQFLEKSALLYENAAVMFNLVSYETKFKLYLYPSLYRYFLVFRGMKTDKVPGWRHVN